MRNVEKNLLGMFNMLRDWLGQTFESVLLSFFKGGLTLRAQPIPLQPSSPDLPLPGGTKSLKRHTRRLP